MMCKSYRSKEGDSFMRWVVKLGSSSVTDHGSRLATEHLNSWVDQIARLIDEGHQIVVVSSGAVAAGMARLGLTDRPDSVAKLQAVAAIGQSDLVQAWRNQFDNYDLPVAQVLLNHSDISNRERYLNARAAITLLLEMPAISVVNENDSVATDEIRLGDNDTLAALVANLIDADGLLLLTDQEGIYTENPEQNPNATLISERDASDPYLDDVVGSSSSRVGTGGMQTKLKAARIAARSGAFTVIAHARKAEIITRVLGGEVEGTRLNASTRPLSSRKQWLAGQLKVAGSVVIDEGAERVLKDRGASLLPVGVLAVQGDFDRGQNIAVKNTSGAVVAHGLTNYSSDDMAVYKGLSKRDLIQENYGPMDLEAIHRDNLVVFE
jgi:glutamate 5-kinase